MVMNENIKKHGVASEYPSVGHEDSENSKPVVNAELSSTNPKRIQEVPHPGAVTPHS